MQTFVVVLLLVIASCTAQTWYQLPGAANEISAKGNEVWVINISQQIFRFTGSSWDHKPGAAVRVGASPDGWTWVVNKNDQIFRWNKLNGDWDLMPGYLVQISAISKDRAMGVNRDSNIYLWENNVWTQMPGKATWAAIGEGDERWVVNSAQQIFRWNHFRKDWDVIPGAAVNIDVQNPCRVVVTNAANQMYVWKNNQWVLITGVGTRATVDSKFIYHVNSGSQIWRGS